MTRYGRWRSPTPAASSGDSEMKPVLEVRGLAKHFPKYDADLVALRDVVTR